jgi:hypothetical protein
VVEPGKPVECARVSVNTRGPGVAVLRESGPVGARGGSDFCDPTFLERIDRALRGVQKNRLLSEEVPRYGRIGNDLEQLREACDDPARPEDLFSRNDRSSVGGLPTQQALIPDPGIDSGSADLELLRCVTNIQQTLVTAR